VRCDTLYSASVNGATLVGDEGSGRFSHEMARGEYHSIGKTVIVTKTDKHWLLPWPVVEGQLRGPGSVVALASVGDAGPR
jgi:hypothetical protein